MRRLLHCESCVVCDGGCVTVVGGDEANGSEPEGLELSMAKGVKKSREKGRVKWLQLKDLNTTQPYISS